MIEYQSKEKIVEYDNHYYNELKKIVSEYYGKELNDVDLNALIEIFQNFLDSVRVQEVLVTKHRNENEEESKKYFGDEFIHKFEKIKKLLKQSNCQLLIHGTSPDLLDSIMSNGLYLSTLDSTTYSCSFDDNYIYSKLLHWRHHDLQGLILIAVPDECLTSGKREKLLNFNKNKSTDANSYYKHDYILKPEFIIGAINTEKREINLNSLYNRNHDYKTMDIIAGEVINPMFMTEEEFNSKKLNNVTPSSMTSKEYLELEIELKNILNLDTKDNNEIFKECIERLYSSFTIHSELSNILYENPNTLEHWQSLDYYSLLEKLIGIRENKQKLR